MRDLKRLAGLFAEYQIHPLRQYGETSPLRVFQARYPESYYSEQADYLLRYQHYTPKRRGADLPWWGEKYFSLESGYRVMVISNNSSAKDAGSVVFFAHLMNLVEEKAEFDEYLQKVAENYRVQFNSWHKIKNQFREWKLDFDYLYITDASKVYQGSSEEEVDDEKSRELLLQEIETCEPDLCIILGGTPLAIIDKKMAYSAIVDKGDYITIGKYKTVVSPYPAGNGVSQKNFAERLVKASTLINNAFKVETRCYVEEKKVAAESKPQQDAAKKAVSEAKPVQEAKKTQTDQKSASQTKVSQSSKSKNQRKH